MRPQDPHGMAVGLLGEPHLGVAGMRGPVDLLLFKRKIEGPSPEVRISPQYRNAAH